MKGKTPKESSTGKKSNFKHLGILVKPRYCVCTKTIKGRNLIQNQKSLSSLGTWNPKYTVYTTLFKKLYGGAATLHLKKGIYRRSKRVQ